jgi:hypothetical protein
VRRIARHLPRAVGFCAAAIVALAACGSPGRVDKAGAVEHTVTTITLELPDPGDPDGGDSADNRLGHNVTNYNAAHGIDVVAGTINGGGNSAHHNTPLPNCVGITCV